jgi:predicted DNA-binding protein
MNKSANIIKFEPEVDIPLELDKETVETIDELTRADGKTRNEILQEALDQFLADYEIGDRLIDFLHSLRETYSAKPQRWDAIKIWQERIQGIQRRLGAETSPPPKPDRAA